MTPAEVREALREVVDPGLGVNIVDLGLVYPIEVVDGEVRVTSMVFAHAPIVLPAVTGLTLRYRPTFYAPLLPPILHDVRLVGDLIEDLGRYRAWGGLLNAFALLVFLLYTASCARWRSAT